MNTILLGIQIVLAVLITVSILLQSQGTGLGATWGGGGESYHTKRGVERFLLMATIALITLFSLIAFINGIVF